MRNLICCEKSTNALDASLATEHKKYYILTETESNLSANF